MQLKSLGTGLNAVAAEAGVEMRISPYGEGREAVAIIDCDAFNGTVKIQSSDDNSTWADVLTVTEAGSDRSHHLAVTLARYLRANVTARTAGECDVQLMTDS